MSTEYPYLHSAMTVAALLALESSPLVVDTVSNEHTSLAGKAAQAFAADYFSSNFGKLIAEQTGELNTFLYEGMLEPIAGGLLYAGANMATGFDSNNFMYSLLWFTGSKAVSDFIYNAFIDTGVHKGECHSSNSILRGLCNIKTAAQATYGTVAHDVKVIPELLGNVVLMLGVAGVIIVHHRDTILTVAKTAAVL